MRKTMVLTSLLILIVSSYGVAVAAPPTSSVIVSNAPSQPVPITAPLPLNVSIFRQPFTLYDSGVVPGTPLDLELATTNCISLLACVFNYSVGATNLPVNLSLDLVYPPLAPPACTGSGQVAVPLLTSTVNSAASTCTAFPLNVIPPCLRVATDGPATSYSVLLLCQ